MVKGPKIIKVNFKEYQRKRAERKKRGTGQKSKIATAALAQGVGAVNRAPFQRPRQHQRKQQSAQTLLRYFDATSPQHLPLPRSVGPYTIIRTTQVVPTSAGLAFFAPFVSDFDGGAPRWIACCGVEDVFVGGAINGVNNANFLPMVGLDPLLHAATVAPAALTVQIMNPEALQTTTGIVYAGRSTAQYELGGSTRTWDDLGNEFVQFMAPRLCSGGKLALRGVMASSYPLDMAELANFRGIRPFSNLGAMPITWSTEHIRPAGLAPIVIYNPNGIGLQCLVTIEWRVRFDPSSPACASHKYPGTAPDSLWDKCTRISAALGHGVQDIAEKTAEVGAMGYGAVEAGALLAA